MQSTSHSDYPPKTMEPFLGSYAPIKQGYGSLYQQQGTNFFQDYRNETLSKFTVSIVIMCISNIIKILVVKFNYNLYIFLSLKLYFLKFYLCVHLFPYS